MRLFVSINPDKETKENLYNVINKFKEKLSENTISKLRWEATDKIHLTLFFLGETPDEKLSNVKLAISKAVEIFNAGIISLGTDSIDAFPDLHNPRVIFFKLKGEVDKLIRLQKLISDNLSEIGFHQDKKFNPHLTFARAKTPMNKNLHEFISHLKFNIQFEAAKVSLMKSTLKSDGARHEELERWGIKKGDHS